MTHKTHKKILVLLFALLICLPGRADNIILQWIAFNQTQTINIPNTSSNVIVGVTYSPDDIPFQTDVYIEEINNHLIDRYGNDLLVQSINPEDIEFVITANTATTARTFVLYGYTSTTLTIVQAGTSAPDPEPDPDPEPEPTTDDKFNIQGNWILDRTYTNTAGTTWYDDITFYNGLGYADQIINIKASSTGTNVVTPVEYDSHFRSDAKVYLPYSSSSTTLTRESAPLTSQQIYYTGKYDSSDGARAYSQNLYESSSLDRISGTRKSGSTYANKITTVGYSSNSANEVLYLKVTYGTIGSVSTATLTTTYYPASTLNKTTVTDEDGGTVIEFKDKSGKVVLQRSLVSVDTYADTYYGYDHIGNLLCVVTPEGSRSLTSGGSYTYTNATIAKYAYLYTYDGYGNMTEKRQPGREAEYYVYDKGRRLVLYQDGNLRSSNRWIYTTYDNFHREVERSLVSTTLSRSSLQGLYHASSFSNKYENLTNPNIPANSSSVSLVSILYSARYHGYTYSSSSDPTESLPFEATTIVSLSDKSTLVHGKLKYEKHLLLTTGTTAQYKETAYYYNGKGELLQSVTKYPNGNILRTSYKYTFLGDIQTKEEICGSTTKFTTYTYDARGRVTGESVTLAGGSAATVSYTYDDQGRVKTRTYGNGVIETTSYNIQGWLTSLDTKKNSTNIYRQTLSYYTTNKGTAARYNGNISEWFTQYGTGTQNTYGFTYDTMGRITSSDRYLGTGTTAESAYTERGITYDRNGNILTLQRYASSLQDNYTYSYEGNKISSISSSSYTHDSNGNMTTDGKRNLQIIYNILNLPQSVNQGSATKATYGWFTDGTKYSVQDNGGNGFYYIGSLIYSISSGSTTLESTDFSEGRITISFGSQSIEYHHKDHLGSIRAITNSTGLTIEQNAYYPFGARHSYGSRWLSSLTNRHKFNGKEEQTTGSLGYLDYGARMYDPQTARWLTQDPLAEKYYPHSPYSFSGNNPVLYVDSDGRAWDIFLDFGFLAYDIGSAIYNHITGNHQQAKQNWVDVGLDVASAFIPGVTAPMTKVAVKGAENITGVGKFVDNTRLDKAFGSKSDEYTNLIIEISEENKIDRSLLNPPIKKGNAPTFKSDGSPVEIHHIGQNPSGPFKEMHRDYHRGKNSYKTNHPAKSNKIDRKEFKKARNEYWRKEFYNK